MYAVLYTQQLEPITVINLAPRLWQMLKRGDWVQVPVLRPVVSVFDPMEPFLQLVTLWAEPLRRRDQESLMVFCKDEELALMLRSDLLPGQRKDHQAEQRRQFARGFHHALSLLDDE